MNYLYFIVHFENEECFFFRGSRVPTLEEAKVFCKVPEHWQYLDRHFSGCFEEYGEVEDVREISHEEAGGLWGLEFYEASPDWPIFEPYDLKAPISRNIGSWQMTDDDTFQHVLTLNGCDFELVEIGILNPETEEYGVFADSVDVLAALRHDEIDETLSALNAFSYDSCAAVREQYGAEANQVIAECIFESSVGANGCIFKGSWAECEDFARGHMQRTLDYENRVRGRINIENALCDLFQRAICEDMGSDDSILREAFIGTNEDDESDCGLSINQDFNKDGTVRGLMVWISGSKFKVTVEPIGE